MTTPTTTIQVTFVSESASYDNTFGWYNSATGAGGILFADVEDEGSNAPLTAGVSTATFTVNTSDLSNIQFFLISNGDNLNSSSELSGPVKVIQLSNGTWAVVQVDSHGNVVLDHGQPNILNGAGVNALFTETSKNAGGVDYASSVVGSTQTAATLAGDTADGLTGQIAWEDLAATKNSNGTYSKPGDADYNDAVFRVSIAPTANADAATVSEDGPATTINVLANDVDPAPGGVLHVSSVNTSGLHGTVTIGAGGSSITYNPGSYFQYLAAGQTATETFTYTATDQFGGSATATTTVTIVGANDAPVVTSANATGAVTEDGSTSTSGTIAFKDVDLTDTHTISAVAGGSGYLGTFTPTLTNDSTGDGSGSVKWSYSVNNSALQFLAAGQTLTQTYTITINDGHGGTVAQSVAITITGTNDGPDVSPLLGFGTVTDNGATTTTGTISFTDVDVADTHTVAATALGFGYVGTFTPVVTTDSAGGTGIVSWTYSVDDSAISFLAAGQTFYQFYKVTVNDGHGGTDSQYVTITINGANDAPVVISSTNGSVTEIADNAVGENTANHTTNGTVTFADPDWTDTHTVSVTPQASGYRGTFTASLFQDSNTAHDGDHDADDVGPGTIKWNFSVNDSALDFLAAGQTLVQSYNVTINDGHGGTVTQVVTVTLVGTNDAPTITSAVTTGAVTELPDGAPGEYVATLTSTGTIAFKDVDLADSHVISVTPSGSGYVGGLTANTTPDSTGTGSGTVTWTYSVLDGAIDFLNAGQMLTQTYTVTIDDGHGGTVSKVVTITINGAADVNHAPTITSAVTTGAIVEDGVTTASGAIGFADVDLNDTHTVTAVAGGSGYLGTFTPTLADDTTGDGAGSVNWNFTADNATLQFLAQGQTLTQTYTVTIDDGHSGTVSKVVMITITGTNDAPVIIAAAGDSAGQTLAETNAGLTATGTLTVLDPDVTDVVSASFVGLTHSGPTGGLTDAQLLGFFGITPNAPGVIIDSTHTSGHLTWNFNSSSQAFDFLAAGETLTLHYTIRPDDGHTPTGTGDGVVTIIINGTNDGPVAVADTNASDPVVESGVAVGGNTPFAGDLSAIGNVLTNDTDPDEGDTRSVTTTGDFTGTYGTLHLSADGSYTYSLNNTDTDTNALAQGESATEVFNYTIKDSQGATSSSTLSIAITGTNDAPAITDAQGSAATKGSVKEDTGNGQVTGQLHATDPDHGATQTWTVVGGTASSNADYHFLADNFIVTKGAGAGLITVLDDEFSDGNPPPSSPPLNPGQPNQQNTTYAGIGSFTESGGKLHLDSDNAVPFVGVGTPDPFIGEDAIVRTNIDPSNAQLGLKQNATFDVSGVFDLILPDSPREEYGIRLTDRLVGGNGTPPDQPGNDVIELVVRENLSGNVVVALRRLDFAADVTTNLQSIALNPPADTDQIRLHLDHAANASTVTASFDYLSGGVVVGTQTLSTTPTIFNGENWTRAEIVADAPTQTDSAQSGSFGTLNINQSGAWTYTLDNSRASTQALAEGQHATDTFTVQVADQLGAIDTRTINVDVVGTNDAPIMQTGPVTRALTEDQSLDASNNLNATGLTQFSDVDLTDSHTAAAALQSAALSDGAMLPPGLMSLLASAVPAPTITDPATGDGHGQLQWNFALADSAVQFLAHGQTLTAHYNISVTDTFGATATQAVTITIAGTNDAPTIQTASDARTVTEDAAVDSSGNLHASGFAQFSDVDLTDTHVASTQLMSTIGVVPPALATLLTGAMTASIEPEAGNGHGQVDWNFALDNSAVQYLAQGQTLTLDYHVNVTDPFSGNTFEDVVVTVVGTNDAPKVDTADKTEFAAFAENIGMTGDPTNHHLAGQIHFSDPDLADHLTASLFSQTATYTAADGTTALTLTSDQISALFGDFQVSNIPGTPNPGFGPWTFDAQDKQFDYLAQDETLTLISDVQVADGNGGVDHASVSVTITGNNDTPTITSAVQSGVVSEGDDGASQTATGQVTFADVDQSDTHTLSVSAAAAYGSASVDQDGAWHYTVSDSGAVDALALGEHLADSFTVQVDDHNGGLATQVVNIDIVGTNDAPVITTVAGQDAGAVVEAGVHPGSTSFTGTPSASGTLTSSDVDHGATATWSGDAAGTYGSFAIDPASGHWTYTLDNSTSGAADRLKQGETVSEQFTATVTDDHGATASEFVTIMITGTNDVPVIATAAGQDAGAVVEAGVNPGNTSLAGTPTASGTLTSSDVDHNATATWSGDTTGTYGSFAIDSATGQWTYTLDNATGGAADHLAQGEVVSDQFTATVTDDFGAIATEVVTLTITGTNDAPVITTASGQNAGAVVEAGVNPGNMPFAGTPSASGTLSSSDVDHGATATWSGSALGNYGSFVIDASGHWTYSLDNTAGGAADKLKQGDVATEHFTVTVIDDFNATATEVVTITITGTNDAPFAVADTNAGDPVVEAGVNPGNTPFAGDTSAAGNVLANDTDVDVGDTHTVTAINGDTMLVGTPVSGAYGTLLLNSDGSYTYTLDNTSPATDQLAQGETATDSFAYTETDDYGASSSTSLSITITGTNDAPVAVADITGGVVESGVAIGGNTPLAGSPSATGNVLTNDTDPDHGDSKTVTTAGDYTGVYGTLHLDPNGGYTYTLNNADADTDALAQGESASDVFSYSIVDSQGATSSSTLTVNISGTNDQPVMQTASVTRALTEDSGVDGTGHLTATGLTQFSDVDLTDTHTASVTLQSSVLSGGGSLPPGLASQLASALTASVDATSEGDADGHGEAQWNFALDNGAVQFLAQGQTLTLDYHLIVTDPYGASAFQDITVTITGTDDTPVVNAISASANEDSGNPVTLTASYTDVDSTDTHSFSIDTTGTLGTVTNNNDGTFSYNPNGQFESLAFGQTATDTFHYTVSDNHGGSATAAATVTIHGENDAPVANNQSFTTLEDTSFAGSLTATDVDSDTVTFSILQQPTNGTLTLTAVPDTLTTVAASAFNGPLQHRSGFPAPQNDAQPFDTTNDLAYSGNGFAKAAVARDDIADTNPSLLPIHQAQFANDGNYGNGASWIANSANDWIKIDLGREVWIDDVVLGRDRTGNFDDRDPGRIQIAVAQNDDVYANGNDANDASEYHIVFDSANVGFNGLINGAQTLQAAFASTHARFVKVMVTNNSTDLDEIQVFGSVNGPSAPFTYVPNANANGSDSFTFQANDGSLNSAPATVNVAITPVNDAPLNVVAGAQTVAEDTNLSITGLSVSDVDAGSASITTTLSVLHGTLTVASAGGAAVSGSGTGTVTLTGSQSQIDTTLAATNNVVYKGVQDFNGSDTLTVTTNDGGNAGAGGAKSDTDTVAITVTAVNDAPVAFADEDAASFVKSTANYAVKSGFTSFPSSSLTVDFFAQVDTANSALTTFVSYATTTSNDNTFIVFMNGNSLGVTVKGVEKDYSAPMLLDHQWHHVAVTYNAATGASQAYVDGALIGSSTYTPATLPSGGTVILGQEQDSIGGSFDATQSLIGGLSNVNVWSSVLSATDVASASKGVVALNDANLVAAWQFDPVTHTFGDASGHGSGMTTVGSLPSRSGPDLNATEQTSLNLKGHDLAISDVDAGSGSVTVTLSVGEGTLTVTSGSSGATVSGSGSSAVTITGTVAQINALLSTDATSTVSYIDSTDTPSASTTLTLSVNDNGNTGSGGPLSGADTATIHITAVNDAPVGVDDTGSATEAGGTNNGTPGSNAIGNVLANDTDVDNTTASLVVSAVRTGSEAGSGTPGTVGSGFAGAHGTLTLNTNGNYTYAVNDNDAAVQALNAGNNLTDTFTYTVKDPGGLTDTAQLTITIHGANDAPVAQNDSASGDEDTAITTGNVLANDSDVDSTLTAGSINAFTQGAHGAVVYNNNGTFTYTPTLNFNGSDSFTYTVTDGSLTSTATVNVMVNPVNDPPVAHDDTFTLTAPAGATFNAANGHYYFSPTTPLSWSAADAAATAAGGYLATITSSAENAFVTSLLHGDSWLGGSDAATEGQWLWVRGPEAGTNFWNGAIGGSAPAGQFANWQGGEPNNSSDEDFLTTHASGLWNDFGGANQTFYVVEWGGQATNPLFVEDNATTIAPSVLLANDTDVDGDILTVSAVGPTSAHGGSVALVGGNVVYTPAANFNGADSFTYTASDGHGGTSTATVSFTVAAVNDAPVNTVPGAQTTAEDTVQVFSNANGNAISISDVDAGTGTETVTLSVTNGNLTLASLAGLTFSTGDGTTDASMTFTGTVSDIDTALNGLSYTPTANFNGGATLTIITNDNGHTGADPGLTDGANAEQDTDTVAITVAAVNDAPVNVVPGAQTVAEDTSLSITGLSVSDVDAGSASISTTLSVAHGTLTVASAGGAAVAGSGTGTVTLTGSQSQIDTTLAALNNVVYKGVADFNGTDTLTVTTNDNGNTGLDPGLTDGPTAEQDTDTVTITVTPVEDTPVVAGTTATGSVPNSNLTATAAGYLTTGNSLVNTLGGTTGFGTAVVFTGDSTLAAPNNTRTDDGSSLTPINLTSLFGAGLNFFGTTFNTLYVNNNGNITFNSALSTFTPAAINGTTGSPIIAPYWSDVDTRGGVVTASSGGHSTGSNLVYQSLDATNHVLTITWDDVGYYNDHTSPVNAYQLQLIGLGNGDFDIVFRYEAINWTTGDASGGSGGLGGSPAREGYTANDGNAAHAFELPNSGVQANDLSLDTTTGNTGITGIDVFQVQGGVVTSAPIANGTVQFSDPDTTDTHTASFTAGGSGYKGTFTLDPVSETNGSGSVAWHFALTNTEINNLNISGTPLVQSYTITVNDGHSGTTSQTVSVSVGTAGNDTINTGHAADVLIGGGGNDSFVFATPSVGTETIVDFTHGSDLLQISASGFGHGLIAGGTPTVVDAASIGAANNPGTNGYFIYDTTAQNLYWDATGGSGSDATLLAHLTNVASLASSDFHIV